jgi:hypothetical protein
LREKLRKIAALYGGAKTVGEREAAAAAMRRVREALAEMAGARTPLVETKFLMRDEWQRRLFVAVCQRYGVKTYRYKRQRRTTVVVRASRMVVEGIVWPQYLQLQKKLNALFQVAMEHVLR